MNIFNFIALICFFIYIFMGVAVYFKQPENRLNRIFFIYSLLAAYTSFTDFQMRIAESHETALFWFRVGVGWHVSLVALLHFVIVFTRLARRRWVPLLLLPSYIMGVVFAVMDYKAFLVVTGPVPGPWGWSYGVVQPTLIGNLFSVWSTALIVLGILLCLQFYLKATDSRQQLQAKYVLIGTAAPMAAGIVEIVCARLGVHIPNLILIFLAAGSAFWFYAIWKYELFVLSPANTAKEIVQTMTDVLLLISPQQTIKVANRAAVELFGYELDELIDQSIAMLFDEDDFRHLQRETIPTELAAHGFVSDAEITIRTKAGKKVSISLAGSLIRDKKGHYQGVAFVGRDITRRKLEERELRNYQERLEEIVAERTAELENTYERLQRVQKLEFMGTLAGGVAHDLNNILSGIVTYPELLLMGMAEDDPLRRPITTIKKSGEKAATIVADLLTLARREVMTKEVVNLNAVVKEYLLSPERAKMQSYHPHARIDTHLNPDLLNMMGSPVHLSKAVMNLVHNGVEAMSDGGLLQIRTENCQVRQTIMGYEKIEPGDYVVVAVSDTGVGIAPQDQERIFEPFYTKKNMGKSGTGLGMAVVWGTVKDHDGYVDVNSRQGQGTTFTLYFPASLHEEAKPRAELPLEQYQGRGETVLVVDDVAEQREIACGILEILGYRTAAVSGGEAAVTYVKDHPVDLLLLDMIMSPGIDGLETYKRIVEIYPRQKAVIASGFSENDRVKEALHRGVGGFVRKPYTIEGIGVAVRKVLDAD